MDSEKLQRVEKKELIGETLEAEDLPLEHPFKKNNKMMIAIKKTPCAYVKDLKESITAYVEDSARYHSFDHNHWLYQMHDISVILPKMNPTLNSLFQH